MSNCVNANDGVWMHRYLAFLSTSILLCRSSNRQSVCLQILSAFERLDPDNQRKIQTEERREGGVGDAKSRHRPSHRPSENIHRTQLPCL